MTEERLKEIEARVTEAGCHALCDEALSPQEIKGNAAVWALVDAAPDFVAEVRRLLAGIEHLMFVAMDEDNRWDLARAEAVRAHVRERAARLLRGAP